jgi:hypothetical protein
VFERVQRGEAFLQKKMARDKEIFDFLRKEVCSNPDFFLRAIYDRRYIIGNGGTPICSSKRWDDNKTIVPCARWELDEDESGNEQWARKGNDPRWFKRLPKDEADEVKYSDFPFKDGTIKKFECKVKLNDVIWVYFRWYPPEGHWGNAVAPVDVPPAKAAMIDMLDERYREVAHLIRCSVVGTVGHAHMCEYSIWRRKLATSNGRPALPLPLPQEFVVRPTPPMRK